MGGDRNLKLGQHGGKGEDCGNKFWRGLNGDLYLVVVGIKKM